MISLASACYGDRESQNSFCARTWSSNQTWSGVILALSSFLYQIPYQKEPEISVGIFSPT